MSRPTHDELIDAIYACVLDPDGWDRTLTRIRQYLHASAINVMSLDVATHANPCLYTANLPQDQGYLYRDYWLSRDPWITALVRKGLGVGGATYCGDMLMERKELIKTPFYNEWLADLDIKDVLGANLWGPGSQWGRDQEHPRIVFGVYRDRAGETFGEIDRQKLEGLSPHLNHAFQIAVRMGMLARNSQLSEAALNALRHAVIALEANARILAANPAGRRWLEQSPVSLEVHNDRLIGFVGDISPSLDEAMAQAKSGRASQLNWRSNTQGKNRSVLTVRLAPLKESVILGLPGQRATFLLIIEAGTQIDDAAFQSFCDLFRLTRAEQKVLRQLMQGFGAEEIGRSLTISPATVRTHIQNIRYKAGAKRISDVVSMAHAASRLV